MRISTSMIFDSGRDAMLRQSADWLHTQQQLSTGKRVLAPSDDPIAAARALEVSQTISINEQFQTNQGDANDALASLESSLGGIGDILTHIRTQAIRAGNAALSPTEHEAIAVDIEAQFKALVGIANSKDGTGEYRFAGYQSGNEPFPADLVYRGDSGVRSIQVAASRTMPVGVPGSDVFRVDANGQSQTFASISDFIAGLRNPPAGGVSAVVANAIDGMDAALDKVNTLRASVGSRMVELDALADMSATQGVQYAETLSRLQDLDYVEAYSRFSKQQAVLEAAQQSYVRTTGLSLFDLLR
ncbi:flagellar hook-associated protein FlgL [Aromatoleum anaerobium]|uniref:Flagellar hook-associated protein 3 n=1 Tax=Aromatoleum anaerobium TaxID=182180 RepID=A0ABX1PTP3_9RHOO|nr:flagellar hook-associated protein FlgL [Aromatoleum anaerobium]MCK0509109.1 flagellar hook-associated protein FlgL [Aromatoleum anaerobium]